MIFIGDVASPQKQYSDFFYDQIKGFVKDKDLIFNLEGLVSDDLSINSSVPILFNHSSIIEQIKKMNCKVVTLANNHTLDQPSLFENTIQKLNINGISYCGAGYSIEQANKPSIFYSQREKIIMFNQCWSVMLQHQKNPSQGVHVATIDKEILFKNISKHKKENPDAKLVVYFHWNFDLEKLPFPADRRIAKGLIDLGVDLVLGCHSHCIQGAEYYKGKPIVYGLGNFFIPWYTYINGHISFPDFSKRELAVEWNPQTNQVVLNFFRYNPDNHQLELYHKEQFSENNKGYIFKEFSPYQGLSDKEYKVFFLKHRRKKYLVPVLNTYDKNTTNFIKNTLIISRIRILRFLAKLKLRSWNN
ncbi:CapA family protein [Psychroflexus sp. ALD_RP9]|uniref:CapA family protein n=1 Tax=Psychroflexus sp. ALD_RP9 TaxID=2777186 RepID=UPI001A8EE844|nr:CapA family protein [Psychroflexus sp. ALD_RP9]QSS98022.1 CapA family protein [Psychroflexus sp. ALD_RP9]